MTCANHLDRASTVFCQNCGKPLCAQCTRTIDGLVVCEPCLLARVPAPSSPSMPPSFVPLEPAATPGAQAGYAPVAGMPPQPYRPVPSGSPSPVLAGFLGCIPGVGAMYNGQFVKALLHVVIFVILVGVANRFDFVGILVAFWIFYQIFDAAQTAAARRDGRPLPDPFGILEMSQRIGPQSSTYVPPSYTAPIPPQAQAAQPAWMPGTVPPVERPGSWTDRIDPQQEARRQSQAAPYVPVPPLASPPALPRRGEPIGAIVLIVVGLLFLLSTLGFLDFDWIGRGWPVLLMLLGVWLLVRRVRTPVQPVPGSFQGFNVPAPAPSASPATPATPITDAPSPIASSSTSGEPVSHNPVPHDHDTEQR